ncbi:MAG: hypothetical protein AMK69_07350 [Nitrospira bacterium SG8_3]|nr:MAG: hypothetical protein AMK69_07350 [Nitrospira bacterium SG8_3]
MAWPILFLSRGTNSIDVEGLAPRTWEIWDAANPRKADNVIESPCFFCVVTSRQGQPGPAFFVSFHFLK